MRQLQEPKFLIPADALRSAADHMFVAERLHTQTRELLSASRKTMDQSRALIVKIDAVLARCDEPGRDLWPVHY
jgi:hypothetical protein